MSLLDVPGKLVEKLWNPFIFDIQRIIMFMSYLNGAGMAFAPSRA
jgi:hypothetical protein